MWEGEILDVRVYACFCESVHVCVFLFVTERLYVVVNICVNIAVQMPVSVSMSVCVSVVACQHV